MGCRVLWGLYDGTREVAVLVDSVTETAFGPLFESEDAAASFVYFCKAIHNQDPRAMASEELDNAHAEWLRGEVSEDKLRKAIRVAHAKRLAANDSGRRR